MIGSAVFMWYRSKATCTAFAAFHVVPQQDHLHTASDIKVVLNSSHMHTPQVVLLQGHLRPQMWYCCRATKKTYNPKGFTKTNPIRPCGRMDLIPTELDSPLPLTNSTRSVTTDRAREVEVVR